MSSFIIKITYKLSYTCKDTYIAHIILYIYTHTYLHVYAKQCSEINSVKYYTTEILPHFLSFNLPHELEWQIGSSLFQQQTPFTVCDAVNLKRI